MENWTVCYTVKPNHEVSESLKQSKTRFCSVFFFFTFGWLHLYMNSNQNHLSQGDCFKDRVNNQWDTSNKFWMVELSKCTPHMQDFSRIQKIFRSLASACTQAWVYTVQHVSTPVVMETSQGTFCTNHVIQLISNGGPVMGLNHPEILQRFRSMQYLNSNGGVNKM